MPDFGSLFGQLNQSINAHPANTDYDFSVSGMPRSPMDSANPMLAQAFQGLGGVFGLPSEALATSQQKQSSGNNVLAEAMQSSDPVTLKKAGGQLMKLGMVSEGASLIQRADAMQSKQNALLDQGQKEIELGVQQAKATQGARMAMSMAANKGDTEAVKMLQSGMMAPKDYMKAIMEARKSGKPVSVADGAMLVDPTTGRVIADNPKTFNPNGPSGGSGNGDYSVYDAKTMDASATAVQELTTAASRADALAGSLKESDIGEGFFGATVPDFLATQLGGREKVQELRTQAIELKNNKVISSLPKGPASDRDIEIISKGFPPDNAGKQEWVNFLGATSRLQRKVAEFEQMRYDYVREGREGNLVEDWKAKATEIAAKEYIEATPALAVQKLKEAPTPKNKAKFLAKYKWLPEGI